MCGAGKASPAAAARRSRLKRGVAIVKARMFADTCVVSGFVKMCAQLRVMDEAKKMLQLYAAQIFNVV
jgi:pyruvate/2-oxoglutarate dehydrogenase complex dihydrolipoamide dehydrogenase (E3) component